jgi:hypothetical protein
MELSTVTYNGTIYDVYFELNHGDIVIKSIEYPYDAENLLSTFNKKDLANIIDILNEDEPREADSGGEIDAMKMFDPDIYESGHNEKDFA